MTGPKHMYYVIENALFLGKPSPHAEWDSDYLPGDPHNTGQAPICVAGDNVRVTTGGPSKMVLPPLAWITLLSERVRQGIEGSKRRLTRKISSHARNQKRALNENDNQER
jgi:hypothetical protein